MRGGSQDEAFKRAVKFLSYRARSEAEVQAKLSQWGFPQKVAQIALEKLRSLNFLNDEAFARDWALSRAEGRGYGPLRIARELREKGVEKSLIDRVVKEFFGAQEAKERAKRLLEKRFRSEDFSDERVLRRAAGFLRRRGYADALIAELVDKTFGDD